MSAIDDEIRAFVATQPVGVLATTRPDGSVRQSVVAHLLEEDRILVSTEPGRAKARDVHRSGHASYCVVGHEPPFPSVTLEGPARILTHGIGAMTTRLFEAITGQEIPTPLTDEQCAAMGRVVLEIAVDHTYGASYLSGG